MIIFKHSGSFTHTERFLNRAQRMNVKGILDRYGKEGVLALSSATPQDTGLTSASWSYEISVTNSGYSLKWFNSVDAGGTPLVILLQYGHGNGRGGYVQGRDFINPAIGPVIDKLAENMFAEVDKV